MLLRFPLWKVLLVVGTLLLGFLACLPNMISEEQRQSYFSWWPTEPLKLGLDLKGGASILLEIDTDDLRTNELRETNRMVGEKLRETPLIPVRERNPQGDAITVRVSNPADTQRALDRLRTLGPADMYAIAQRPDGAIEIKFTQARFDQLMERAVEALARPCSAGRTIPA
jgi:preprotein translocase subunit SecD